MKVSATVLLAIIGVAFCYRRSYVIQAGLERIVGTPDETIEAVQALFSSLDGGFDDNFVGLDSMGKSVNPEAFKYVLSKTARMDKKVRAADIAEIIHTQLYDSDFGLTPEDPGFNIVRICLTDLSQSGSLSDVQDTLISLVGTLISSGNIPLLQLFFDSGVQLPSNVSISPAVIQKNTMPTVNCLLEHGMDLSKAGHSVIPYFSLPSFKARDFEKFLQCGLPTNCNYFACAWLELSMRNGRLDLARVAYLHGQKFEASNMTESSTQKFKRSIQELANYIAIQEAFERTRPIISATFDEGHVLYGLSLASVYGEMFSAELGSAADLVMPNLIR